MSYALTRYALVIIAALLFVPAVSVADDKGLPDPDEQFNTFDIITRTAEQIPACIDYCVIGACIHFEYLFPYGINVVISPRIQHYLPDYMVQAYKEPEEEPYMEWSKIFGPAKMSFMDELMKLMGATPMGTGGHDVVEKEYANGDRETFYKEVDVIGHPLALLPKILRKDGSMGEATDMGGDLGEAAQLGSNGTTESGDYWCDWDAGTCDDGFTENEEGCGPDCHDDDLTLDQAFEIGAEGAAEFLADYGSMASPFMDPRLSRMFNVVDAVGEAKEMFETVTELVDMVQNMQEITDVVGGVGIGVSGEFKIEEILCDTPVMPFVPYYMSTMDAFFWRNGWPLTDIEHAIDVINPFSSENVSQDIDEWGNLFPRHGFLQQYHDKKAAAVMAARAVDVTVEETSYRIRIPPPDEPSTGDWEATWTPRWTDGKWSELHPEPKKECHSSVAYGGDLVDTGGKTGAGHYAWTFWRQYDCCMQTGGVYITTVDLPESCIL